MGSRIYLLTLLTLLFTLNLADRSILAITMEPIKVEFGLSDTEAGFLAGMAFSLLHIFVSIPMGAIADRVNRRNLVAVLCTMWSALTIVCGACQSYLQLVFARIMVGATEAGGPPACLSMISDTFPKEQRGRAIAVFYLSIPVSLFLVYMVGAWVTEHYGWRYAFFVAGVPGFLVAILVYLTVKDPIRGQSDQSTHTSNPSFPAAMHFIGSQPAIRHLFIGLTITTIVKTGEGAFIASFLIRIHDFSINEAGQILGLMLAAVGVIGIAGGGLLADKLGNRDERWRCWVSAISVGLGAPFLTLMLLTDSTTIIALSVGVWAILSNLWVAPTYSLIQGLVGVRMRSTVGAIQFLLAGAVSYSIGPLLVGILSDSFDSFGVEAIRYALLIVSMTLLWAAPHFALAAKTVQEDMMRASQA